MLLTNKIFKLKLLLVVDIYINKKLLSIMHLTSRIFELCIHFFFIKKTKHILLSDLITAYFVRFVS